MPLVGTPLINDIQCPVRLCKCFGCADGRTSLEGHVLRGSISTSLGEAEGPKGDAVGRSVGDILRRASRPYVYLTHDLGVCLWLAS